MNNFEYYLYSLISTIDADRQNIDSKQISTIRYFQFYEKYQETTNERKWFPF
jgi:hypothetical protein